MTRVVWLANWPAVWRVVRTPLKLSGRQKPLVRGRADLAK
ncbi:hypothetical protein IHEIED_00455 [Methylorubrum populi]